MTARAPRRRLVAAAAPVVVLAAVVGGCAAAPGPAAPDAGPAALPAQEPGVVGVDGGPGTLAAAARASYAAAAPDATVTAALSGESRAFGRLCAGEIDVADTGRPMTPAEYEQCRRRGLDVVQLAVAAEATVVVVDRRADVGTDCLTTAQLRAGLAGSAVERWRDLDDRFADLPFALAGPPPVDVAGDLRADTRRDYRVLDDASTRLFVVGSGADVVRARSLPAARAGSAALRDRIDRARTPAAVVRLRARLVPVEARARAARAARDRLAGRAGHVGLLRYGSWSAAPGRLRALGVAVTAGACVVPTDAAVVDGRYPLTRRDLLTVTGRALERPEVRAYLVHYLRDSRRLAVQAGAVPLSEAEVEREVGRVTAGGAPAAPARTPAVEVPVQ